MGEPRRLNKLELGTGGKVLRCEAPGALGVRLAELGVVPGATLRLLRRAPMGDPLELELMGYHLSLRGAEAATIWVEVEG